MGFLAFAGRSILAVVCLIIGVIFILAAFIALAITLSWLGFILEFVIGILILLFGIYTSHAAREELHG